MLANEEKYDLLVVGAGPAGLSAAINAESESIDALVIDAADRLGGQAGTSSLIENYPGFPGGVSGKQLTGLMVDQALKFNTEFLAPLRAERIEPVDEGFLVHHDSETILGRAVLVSAGVEYRHLLVPNLAAYLGRGVSYGSPNINEAFSGKEVFVVGGANSAGQAAMHLSKFTDCNVNLLVRGRSIEEKMSSYLSDRIMNTDNINVHTETEVVAVDGDGHLNELTLQNGESRKQVSADELFVMIGAVPRTSWLPEGIERDKHGFVMAGGEVNEESRKMFIDAHKRPPLSHETTVPGLFVAGDVRSGTIKRVASAVGDGATVVPDIHKYCASLAEKSAK